MPFFTWLHISDFHFTNPLDYSRDLLFKQLLRDIERQCAEGKQPDAIFFTGDISFSGQGSQYEIARAKFDELLAICNLSGKKERLFIVPGNHDVNRRNINDGCRFITKKILERTEDSYVEVDKMLLDDFMRKRFLYRFNEYELFFRDYFGDLYNGDEKSYYYVTEFNHSAKQIAIVALNSAWMSQEDNEQGRLFLGRVQVNSAIEELEKKFPNSHLKIVLAHHPLYWLSEADMATIEPLISNSCSVYLHGHLHTPRLNVHGDPDTALHMLAAGSGFESRSKINAYNIVRLDLDTGKALATLRFQHPDYSVNWGDDTLTYRNAVSGKFEFKIKLW
jgi:3',5'-cyclic AMP phosphodiesterase CpdA